MSNSEFTFWFTYINKWHLFLKFIKHTKDEDKTCFEFPYTILIATNETDQVETIYKIPVSILKVLSAVLPSASMFYHLNLFLSHQLLPHGSFLIDLKFQSVWYGQVDTPTCLVTDHLCLAHLHLHYVVLVSTSDKSTTFTQNSIK